MAVSSKYRRLLDARQPSVALESPFQAEVERLVAELDAYQAELYPAESNHFLGLQALAQPDVRFAVVRGQDGLAIGCGAIVVQADYCELKRMYVRPDARGLGLAKILLNFLEEQAAGLGHLRLQLETGIRQPEAIALYERSGYRRCGPFGSYREDPLSIFMCKVSDST